MAVAIDTSRLALDVIPQMQRALDRVGGDGRRFQIHRVSAYATILPPELEIGRHCLSSHDWIPSESMAKPKALAWQADPDDDLGDAAVLHHLHQHAATVPLLSSVIYQSNHGNAATTLTGSALSVSINARTQGRLLSSFHRQCFRVSSFKLGNPRRRITTVSRMICVAALFNFGVDSPMIDEFFSLCESANQCIVWAGPHRNDQHVFWQLQVDVVDLCSRRTHPTSRPGKRIRTAFNPFLQVSVSPVVEDTSRGNPLPQTRRFNGVRHRLDRRTWVAEMKPPKQKTKQDFGNFKSETEAARAVDAAFYHYGRPDLLNFPDTSVQFLSERPTADPRLDEKAKVKFVKEEAKLLLAAIAVTSPLHSNPTNSLPFPIPELSASPRRCPSGRFRPFSEISSPVSCFSPDEVDDVVSQPQPCMVLDSTCNISTTGVLTNFETLSSVQITEPVWDWSADSSTLAAPPNVVNSSACEIHSIWLDSLIRSPPAPTYSRSPSPSHFQEEIACALLEQQSPLGWCT